MFIINPLGQYKRDNLFSTHPDTENRIRALEQLANQWENEDRYMDEETDRGPWASDDHQGDDGSDMPWGRSR